MFRSTQPRTLAWYLVAFGLALALPLILYAGTITIRFASAERARVEDQARGMDRAILVAVDQEVTALIAALQALAGSQAIWDDDLSAFYTQALHLAHVQGAHVVLQNAAGRQIMNSRVPWGTMLPSGTDLAMLARVADTRGAYVSGLMADPVTGEPVVIVTVPVMQGNDVGLLLSTHLPVGRLHRLIMQTGLTHPYYGSVTDREGRILSRSQDHEAFVGRTLPGFSELTGTAGTWTGHNFYGDQVLGIYERSALTGWTTAVGIQAIALEAPLRRSYWILAGLAASLGAIGLVAALLISRRIAQSTQALAVMAYHVGRGRTVTAPRLPVREANLIAEALANASTGLRDRDLQLEEVNKALEERVRDRTTELAQKTILLQATLDNMDQGLMLVDADGTVPLCNQRALELLDLPEDLMTSRPTFEAVRNYQLSKNDFARSEDAVRLWVAKGGVEPTLHVYERERPNGVVLEIRTVPLPDGGAVRTYTDITARKQAERKAAHMARHDALTDLPNRTLFRERLDQEIAQLRRHGGTLAVFCLDLDRFKIVNDTLGHLAGDSLLQEVSRRIRGALRAEDAVARLGGDEFAILQTGLPQPHSASALARRLIDIMAEPVFIDGQRLNIGVSVGVSLAPDDGLDADTLFKAADLALYRAKNEGRNTVRFYEAGMDAAVQARRALELDMREALARGDFELHYQPMLDVARGSISGFEALLRWNHPKRGLISPAEFIPLAEETGLIAPLGEWVLRSACNEAASWPDPVKVAVNISAVQFNDAGLMPVIVSALAHSGLPARRLEIEITESVLIEESDVVLHALHELRRLGVRISMDDFGTGYSSLSYLRKFSFDKIKIDRSFVNEIDDTDTAAIVRAIVGLGSRLGIAITAEGVETAAQLELLRREGCTEVQGFLVSPAVPPERVPDLLGRADMRVA